MHFIDKAREYQKYLDENQISAYKYSRVLGEYSCFIGNYTRLMRFSDKVLDVIKYYNLSQCESAKLLKLVNNKDDNTIIKMIKFIKYKKLNGYKVNKLIEYEMMKDRR
ncbi:MAG: hypothetical protein ACFFD2_17190 [Promethearchaeota archaeon]